MRGVHGGRRIRWLMAAWAFALALWAAPARATDAVIDGSPLNIYANDNGQLQVAFDGSPAGEFFPSGLAPANAGLIAGITDASQPAAFDLHGFLFAGSPFDPTVPAAPPVVTGDGSAGNPWKLSTSYRINPASTNPSIRVVETLSYVNGTTDVGAEYQVFNESDSPNLLLHVRLYEVADLYVNGDDHGVGFFDPGPPRQLGGINQAAGSSGRLVEQTPWTHYQEGPYGDVFAVAQNSDSSAQGFADTMDPTLIDNGAGVQWDIRQLAVGSPQTVSVLWRFRHFTPLQLSLVAAAKAQGQVATVSVAARNSDGNPDPGRAIRYTISGANPGLGTVTAGADGNATISWVGENQGVDTLTAFTDLNGNGTPDAGEPTQSVTVTWAPPLPPVPGKSVVVRVVSGTVLVKYPSGYTPRATSPAKGFVPFRGAANLPVGTQLDTRKGRVNLTSAADTGGKKTQASDFYDGIFQIKQALPKKKSEKALALITDVVMKGQLPRSGCAPLKGASAAAVDAKKKGKKGPKSVLGKLWGNGKGKFRTTGKYSSATVRGTMWLTQDECDGTLTKVKRGVVSVRDFKRKTTVKVKAGHSYLSRAQRAASKGKRHG